MLIYMYIYGNTLFDPYVKVYRRHIQETYPTVKWVKNAVIEWICDVT
jgi:hypothetical protein